MSRPAHVSVRRWRELAPVETIATMQKASACTQQTSAAIAPSAAPEGLVPGRSRAAGFAERVRDALSWLARQCKSKGAGDQ